jgi:predicted Fe-Mo cluster-binding NifX family protein
MKIALPLCGNRLSTVFDAADELLIVETRPGAEEEHSRMHWGADSAIARIAQLRESGVQILICGALSGPLECMLSAAGIRVIPFVRGTDSEILDAFRSGTLKERQFYLPGCAPCTGRVRRGRYRGGGCGQKGWGKS